MKSVDDFEDSVLDVTMTRYLESRQHLNTEQEEMDDLNGAHDATSSDESVWTEMYRIKPEYAVRLSRGDLLSFQIENGKGSVILRAHSATIRERDILAIVIKAVADAKKERKQRKKASQDLVELRIDVVDPTASKGRKSKSASSVEQYNQIRELKLKMARMNDQSMDLQKVRCVSSVLSRDTLHLP